MDRQVRELRLVQVNAAGVDRDEADDHVEAGGLAGAIRAEQAHHLTARHLERDVLHHGARLVALPQPLGAKEAAVAGLHFSGGFGCIVARTRPSPLPGVTVKRSERWSTRM